VNYPLTPTTHTIDINQESGFAYLNGGFYPAGPPLILDINNPKVPIPAGFNNDDGYTHDSLCRIYRGPDSRYNGKEICFNFNEDTINIYDMTNKLSPVRLARVTYPAASYVHSGSLTMDHHYLLSDDETDSRNIVFIWDVSKLDDPQMIGQYTGDIPAIDHNTYIDGNYAYLANYKAGMRLLDLSEVSTGTLTEVAYFDVAPQAPHGGYDGAWSVYPYLSSGKVLISGMNQGLFVVDVRFECLEEPQPPSCSA
jgi:choice-of-anchor B domain-containing protein